MPILAIPTTYAGSDVTSIYGLTECGVKKSGRVPRVLPKTVIYDSELTLPLPLARTVDSALNAIAHAAKGLYAPDGIPGPGLRRAAGLHRGAAASVNALDP